MKNDIIKKYNYKSIIAGLLILLAGICLILLDYFSLKTAQNLWISIGCSLIASSLVILVNALLVEEKIINPLEEWKISKIYHKRSEKSNDSDPKIKYLRNNLDVVAFGLKSFRTSHGDDVKKCIENGTVIRILTMSPTSSFISEREKEENETEGQILNTINSLIKWAEDLNSKTRKSKKIKMLAILKLEVMIV